MCTCAEMLVKQMDSGCLRFVYLCLASFQILFGDLAKFMWLIVIVLIAFSTCKYSMGIKNRPYKA